MAPFQPTSKEDANSPVKHSSMATDEISDDELDRVTGGTGDVLYGGPIAKFAAGNSSFYMVFMRQPTSTGGPGSSGSGGGKGLE